MSTSLWPAPTVSISTMSNPAASSTRTTSPVAAASPPRLPRFAMLRMNTPRSPARSVMRIRSPSTAPPLNGLVGSTATMPTVRSWARSVRASALTTVDLPVPGAPVIPTR